VGFYFCARDEKDPRYALEPGRVIPELKTIEFTHAGTGPVYRNGKIVISNNIDEIIDRIKHTQILILYRCPEEVLVSYYFHMKNRKCWYKGTLSQFIRDKQLGVEKFAEFYQKWLRAAGDNFYFLTYRHLHGDSSHCLAMALGHFWIEPNMVLCKKAAELGSFSNLKKLERDGYFIGKRGQTPNIKDPQSYKFREGLMGIADKYLSKGDKVFIKKATAGLGQYGKL